MEKCRQRTENDATCLSEPPLVYTRAARQAAPPVRPARRAPPHQEGRHRRARLPCAPALVNCAPTSWLAASRVWVRSVGCATS
eukprot:4421739-Prymnesium_polylepis.1